MGAQPHILYGGGGGDSLASLGYGRQCNALTSSKAQYQ